MAPSNEDRKRLCFTSWKTPQIAPTKHPTGVHRHLVIGWAALLLFVILGTVLEIMHGFKIQFYLNVTNETRRLMWTLSHAHGVLLGLVNLAFAAKVYMVKKNGSGTGWASALFSASTILLPGGFFLGETVIDGSDPGLGVFLVLVGALFLFLAVLLTLWDVAFSKSQ